MKNGNDIDDFFSVDFENVPLVKNERAKMETWARLSNMIDDEKRVQRKVRLSYSVSAVSVALCLALAVFLHFSKREHEPSEVHPDVCSTTWMAASTEYGEKKQVVLSDGSVIWIHNGAKLVYPGEFETSRRQVFVEGEVFADIAKDASRPFLMSTNGSTVKVKGTKFNFKSNPGTDEVEVTLVEGSVDLIFGEGANVEQLDMEAGSIVKANTADRSYSRREFDPSSYVNWVDMNVLYFNDETLESIVGVVEQKFGVKVVVKRKSLLKLRYFASFVNDETPLQIFLTLAADNGMTVCM